MKIPHFCIEAKNFDVIKNFLRIVTIFAFLKITFSHSQKTGSSVSKGAYLKMLFKSFKIMKVLLFCESIIKNFIFQIDLSLKDNSCESEKSSENLEAPPAEHQVFKAVFHDIMFQNSKPDEEAIGKANM